MACKGQFFFPLMTIKHCLQNSAVPLLFMFLGGVTLTCAMFDRPHWYLFIMKLVPSHWKLPVVLGDFSLPWLMMTLYSVVWALPTGRVDRLKLSWTNFSPHFFHVDFSNHMYSINLNSTLSYPRLENPLVMIFSGQLSWSMGSLYFFQVDGNKLIVYFCLFQMCVTLSILSLFTIFDLRFFCTLFFFLSHG